MKKWGLFILLFLALIIISQLNISAGLDVDIKEHSNPYVEIENSEESIKVDIKENQLYEGNLLLVNEEHMAHKQSIKNDIVKIAEHEELMNGYEVLNNPIYLSEEIARKFSNMMVSAEKEGVSNFMITSGFRSFEEQEELFQEMGSEYALPAGYSEHNLGLSLDIGSTKEKIANSPQGNWIEKNSWKYGFILRYPKNKTNITGIQYEPWHFRYVGLPHSAVMKKKNLVLEEYLEYLKRKKQISVTLDERKYVITYYTISESRTINIPANSKYELSGDNMNGVIVTYFES